jgi:hypothetical protein
MLKGPGFSYDVSVRRRRSTHHDGRRSYRRRARPCPGRWDSDADAGAGCVAGTGRAGLRECRPLRWCLQHDVPVISKSVHRERLLENAQIFGFALSATDMAELDALDQTGGTDRALERTWW